MTTWVGLLRGVNVGGITIRMAELRKVLTAAGFRNVRTVLASGNIVCDADEDAVASVKSRMEGVLREAFGYEAWVVVLDPESLRRIVEAYPFPVESAGDAPERQPYVMFSSDPETLAEIASSHGELDPRIERIALADEVLYWEVEKGKTLGSVFGKHSSKARYKSAVTTRNLRTLHKILAA